MDNQLQGLLQEIQCSSQQPLVLYEKCRQFVEDLVSDPARTEPEIRKKLTALTCTLLACGYEQKAVLELKLLFAYRMGKTELAKDFYHKWLIAPRYSYEKSLVDENISTLATQTEYFLYQKQWLKAWQYAEKLLREAPLYHPIVLHVLALSLLPLAKLGYHTRIEKWQRKAQPKVSRLKRLEWVGHHLCYLTTTKQWSRALRLLEKHARSLSNPFTSLDQWWFILGAYFLLKTLTSHGIQQKKLRLGGFLASCKNRKGQYDLHRCAKELKQQLTQQAEQYDRRNRNNWYNRKIHELSTILV